MKQCDDSRYELHESIGRGGMATVFGGYDTVGERDVAIKVLHPHLAADEGIVEAFEREAALMQRLDHPGVVQVYGVTKVEGRPAVVMQRCDGGDLRDRIARRGRFAEEEALEVMGAILDALAAVHDEGIVHRDVKPGNVVFDVDGNPKLIDFGIGQAEELMEAEEAGQLGTVEYMAPERAQGYAVDARSDIYAAGVMLFEMLCGHVPYRAESAAAVMRMHREAPIPDIDFFADGVSGRTRGVIERALAKNPQRRFDDVARMAAVLCEKEEPVEPVEDHPYWARLVQRVEWRDWLCVAPDATHEWMVVTADARGHHHVDLDAQIKAIRSVVDDYSEYATGAGLTAGGARKSLASLITPRNTVFSGNIGMYGKQVEVTEAVLDVEGMSERQVAGGLTQEGAEMIAEELEQRGGDVRLMRRSRHPNAGRRRWISVAARTAVVVGLLLMFVAIPAWVDVADPAAGYSVATSWLVGALAMWLLGGFLIGAVWGSRGELFRASPVPMLDFSKAREDGDEWVVNAEHIEVFDQIGSPQVAASYRRALNMLMHLHDPYTTGRLPDGESVEPMVEKITGLARRIIDLERRLAAGRPVQLAARTRRLDELIGAGEDPEVIERLVDEKAELRARLEERDAARQRLEMMAQRMLEVAGQLERLVREPDDEEVVFDFDDVSVHEAAVPVSADQDQ